MQDNERLTPGEMELAAALAGLKPAAAAANRDRVMFLAGRASMRRRSRLWQGASTLLALALVVSLAARPKPTAVPIQQDPITAAGNPVLQVSVASEPADDIDSAKVEAFRDYVRLRRAVLEQGVDVLPTTTVSPASENDSPTPRRQLERLLSTT